MAKYEGYCFNCNFKAGRTAIKNHITKEHNKGQYECYLIRAEGDSKGSPYWLFFSTPKDLMLEQVDDTYSGMNGVNVAIISFYAGRSYDEIEMDRSVASFKVGDTFRYEYDFGSTTRIKLTVVAEIFSELEFVMPLAKNEKPEHKCTFCGDEADNIYSNWPNVVCACDECSENEEFDWLPIVNSPRMGVCGYTGEGGFNLKPPFRNVDVDDDFGGDRNAKNWKENAELIAEMTEQSERLLVDIREIIENAKNNAVRSVNSERVQMYWKIGRRIVVEEQNNNERAEYGKNTLTNLSKVLEKEYGNGFSKRLLEIARQFYLIYPIANALRSQLVKCCEFLGMDDMRPQLEQMMVIDFIIANTDRHWGTLDLFAMLIH